MTPGSRARAAQRAGRAAPAAGGRLRGAVSSARRRREEDGYERWERLTDAPLLALAAVFLGVLLFPFAVPVGPGARAALNAAATAIWAVFACDYAVRLYLSPDRWRFARTHPLELAVVVLPLLQPFRALPAVRVLHFGSLLGVANRRAHRSLHAQVSVYVATAAAVVLVVAGTAMAGVERREETANIVTVADGLWWAVTTVTTVGYGDRYPVTPLGRLIAVALMIVGIALIGVVTASFAAWFVGRLRKVEQAADETESNVQEILVEVKALRREVAALRSHVPDGGQQDEHRSLSGDGERQG